MKLKLLMLAVVCTAAAYAQETYRFDFTGKARKGYVRVDATMLYDDAVGYGFDFGQIPSADGKSPFFFSVKVILVTHRQNQAHTD